MSRIGFGRHGGIDERAGDPLDGLVNLFDIGMILAVAFLIAGLALTFDAESGSVEPRAAGTGAEERVLAEPRANPTASGRGEPVGQVYRLPDGRLVYVEESR